MWLWYQDCGRFLVISNDLTNAHDQGQLYDQIEYKENALIGRQWEWCIQHPIPDEGTKVEMKTKIDSVVNRA